MEDSYYTGAGHYDRETVRFFDVAHEGAQLRAIAQAAQRLSHLRGMQPRSVVVLGTDQIALAAARALVAVRTPLELPVLVTDALPSYVGPLDVVLVVGDAAAREQDARGLAAAAGRGAETVLAGPARGPLLDDAPSSTTILPALPTAAGASPARTIAAVAAVLDALTGDPDVIAGQLEVLAEEVDAELTSLSPERDASVNPARQLRAFAADARVLHSGTTRCGRAIAQLVAEIWSARGLASGFVDAEELALAVEFGSPSGAARADDIFYDPYLDGPLELVPLKTVLWAQPAGAPGVAVPNSRAETVEAAGLGDTAQALRLITRAYAATILDDASV
ncbi:hypothetical protein M5J20_07190 [Corynebacterium sp. TA-R-1]|uniref:Exopolyphosphatase n=1 Tax=Corynebacterium stercoris TaxID=2943490 RepID=A0ABT1G4G9_9CORY|nr:hypothetical protein [Corynebacterium stercoris]MCP1387973.1 hypothetical protein [Corynebacterium stercoris]